MFIVALLSSGCRQLGSAHVDPFDVLGSGAYGYDGIFVAALQHGLGGDDRWQVNMAAANVNFRDCDPPCWPSGSVRLNADTLKHSMLPQLSSWPKVHVWEVTDNGEFGSFRDSVMSPELFEITYPKQLMQLDTISLSRGFSISYGNTGCDHVRITIISSSMLANSLDSTIPLGKTDAYFISPVLPSTGSYEVAPAVLDRFPAPGVIRVSVGGQISKVATHNGRKYLFRTNVTSSLATFTKR